MTKVINLIGGPGCGKSTTAAGLFFAMKCAGHRCELVTEFAKELTYDKNWIDLKRQLYVLAEQERRQRRLLGEVDFIITDCPLLLSIAYISDPMDHRAVDESARNLWAHYDNINFGLIRTKPYRNYGRSQSESEARAIDHKLVDEVFKDEVIEAFVPGDHSAPREIYEVLCSNHLA
ncbi:AAA family ATPase [Bradyrhizobium sp. th.b2]|uniref:AAA family ATPase n=1 Tax=Bradyrhizobium sp. th-b2 TaxID=172088 RepID=UPI0004049371|nr:AAA family ATPase [Bradyrhizobium sp. th.b2]